MSELSSAFFCTLSPSSSGDSESTLDNLDLFDFIENPYQDLVDSNNINSITNRINNRKNISITFDGKKLETARKGSSGSSQQGIRQYQDMIYKEKLDVHQLKYDRIIDLIIKKDDGELLPPGDYYLLLQNPHGKRIQKCESHLSNDTTKHREHILQVIGKEHVVHYKELMDDSSVKFIRIQSTLHEQSINIPFKLTCISTDGVRKHSDKTWNLLIGGPDEIFGSTKVQCVSEIRDGHIHQTQSIVNKPSSLSNHIENVNIVYDGGLSSFVFRDQGVLKSKRRKAISTSKSSSTSISPSTNKSTKIKTLPYLLQVLKNEEDKLKIEQKKKLNEFLELQEQQRTRFRDTTHNLILKFYQN